MLEREDILNHSDASAIREGLRTIQAEIEAGEFDYCAALEDIHMNIEARLRELIGDAAGRLHTARSRNDQVATDLRLWTRERCDDAAAGLRRLMLALLDQASNGADMVMPGFTHLQTAQPVTWGHYMMAYLEMLGRDLDRFQAARARLNESPLGAAALAGTSFPIDRDYTAKALGFARPMGNSIDAVSDRDFVLDYLSAAAAAMTHLSRLAEEIVLWCSDGFSFALLGDSFTTGSSIMPQKRNPDAAELIRAKTGRVTGALVAILTVLKGLPLAYSKDMQEDKEQLFDAADTLELALAAMAGMIMELKPDSERLREAADSGYSTATDLADWLVKNAKVSFREAHATVGAIVRLAETKGCRLSELSLDEMQSISTDIDEDAQRMLDPVTSVASRQSYGGTSPACVRQQIARWKEKLD